MKFMVVKVKGDARYDYLEKRLLKDGHEIVDRPEDAEGVVLPMIGCMDGVHITGTDIVFSDFVSRVPKNAMLFGGVAPCPVLDYLKEPAFRYYNAIPTAEGAVATALVNYPKTIWNSRSLIIGFGHVGKHLARILHGMGAHVTVAARKDTDRAFALSCGYEATDTEKGLAEAIPHMDLVFNAAPAATVSDDMIKLFRNDTVVIELVSSQNCMNTPLAREMGVNVIEAKKLPGTYAPEMAGDIIAEAIYRLAEKNA